MDFYRIRVPDNVKAAMQPALPETLPIFHNDTLVARAVWLEPYYAFVASHEINAQLDTGDLTTTLLFSDTHGTRSLEYYDGHALIGIGLVEPSLAWK